MDVIEILLLIAGVIIFVLSFLIPVKGETKLDGDSEKLARGEVKQLVADEMAAVRGHVDEVVEEAVAYAMEKTERSLERLSNEKIMAVKEYSDTVLGEIHKNHEEAMFLYDMLNNKHVNLKNTVSEVNRTVKEVEETVTSFQKLTPGETENLPVNAGRMETERAVDMNPAVPAGAGSASSVSTKEVAAEGENAAGRISFMEESSENGKNSNERILELYGQGKSKVAIAKELGLGVGEVKLVIDLFKNQ